MTSKRGRSDWPNRRDATPRHLFSSGRRNWVSSSMNAAEPCAKPLSRSAANIWRLRSFLATKPRISSTTSANGLANKSENEEYMSTRTLGKPCPADDATTSAWLLCKDLKLKTLLEEPAEEKPPAKLTAEASALSSCRATCPHCGCFDPTGEASRCASCDEPLYH